MKLFYDDECDAFQQMIGGSERSFKECAAFAGAKVKQRAACDPSNDDGREPAGRPSSTYARENHGDASERAGSADKCASRENLQGCAGLCRDNRSGAK